VLGDEGRNGLFFVHLVCCCEYSGFGWLVVGIHLVFDGTARLPFFWGEGEGEVWIFVIVLLVPFWSREDDEYGGRQGGSGLGTIVFSSG
jgi:hypothetical protein